MDWFFDVYSRLSNTDIDAEVLSGAGEETGTMRNRIWVILHSRKTK